MIFAFAGCEIDVERRELHRDGRPAHVEPQVFDVLLHLIKHRDRVVGKDELFQAVWNGRIISEATLSGRISAARRAIGDTGERQKYLRTIARRGFRFCGEVEERVRTRLPPATSVPSEAVAWSPDQAVTNLPLQPTSFLGRDQDIAEVAALLSVARLVTLTGVGGVGKTRLAITVAAAVAPNYPDGVRLVEFAAVSDPGATGHAVAGVLGVAQQSGKTIEESVVNALRGGHQLLVFDNCEHLINAIAALARDILVSCPRVTLLATSREGLMVHGEQAWPVPPLGFDGIASPAVQLFAERARAVVPDFALGADGEAVSEICRRLDGIPLAIELAAARTRALSPSQIRDRLDERFRLLTGGSRRAVERHQTLRHAVQWSYDLLSPVERAVLAHASAFAGGFTLDAAERVCAGAEVAAVDVLDLLDSLVRKSLVTVERSGDVVRYGLLETIRQFGEEQLAATGESEAVRLRHAQFFAEDSDTRFKIWRSPRQLAAYEWLDREIGNLRAAFRWASDRGDVDVAARIASNIGDMARFRIRDEAASWAAEIVDAARLVRHRRLAVLLSWAASSAWGFGRLEEAKRYGEEAISLAGNPDFDPFVWAFIDLAMVACYEGDVDRAIELTRAGAADPADRHDRACLVFLPDFLTLGGCRNEAIEIADRIVAAAEATGIPTSICIALWAKGVAFAATDPAEALAAYERAIAVTRVSGNRWWEIVIILEVAALQARSGDPITALCSFRQMLDWWRRSSDLLFVSHGLGSLIVLFERLGQVAAAATLIGTLTRTFESNPFVPELPDTLMRVRTTLGDTRFDETNRRGAAMALHEAYDYALDQIRQALASLGVGDAGH
jgi:predicted ATPase/DNA-binding winged helix-turn-helix (wHTH) protein